MPKTEVSIPTPDGAARAFVFRPATGSGPWPAVIFYMDAPAIRPALFEMGERLASNGYYVLMPDMFWRFGPYAPVDLKSLKDDEARRAAFGPLMASTNPERAMSDTGAFLAWLDGQPDAKAGRVGCTGYCMGGGMALRAAAAFPDRIVAAAGFHAARLATDAPDSPHLLAPKIKARVYMGGADQDAGFPPEQADLLRRTLTDAGVDNRIEIYAGARHGYAPSDTPVYNPEASERHWRELLALLDATLKQPAAA